MAQTDLHFSFETGNHHEDDETAPILFDVVEFHLLEALNEPFVLDIELSSSDAAVEFDKVLDQSVVLTIWQGSQAIRQIHGIVSNFTQGKTGFRRTRYHAIVEPMLSRTRLYSDWRIFQQKTVPEILGEVFKADHLTNFDLQQQRTHLSREYCVQADETDFQYIQRLLAEEGFVYRFAHSEQGHQLILTDVIQTFGAIGNAEDTEENKNSNSNNNSTVLYQPDPGGDQPQPALHTFTYQESVTTARQTQRDYTFRNPRYSQHQMSIGRDMTSQSTEYERYDYPGRYKQDAVGAPFTQTKLASLRREAKVAVAIGDDARIEPGIAFELTGHPRSSLNTLWRPVHIEHTGKQYTSGEEEAADATVSTSYTQTAQLVPATTDWKAEIPPKPHVHGPEIAHVVGPQGEEIYTDEYGRVKVQFPWDRIGSNDEHSTCWIRVAQNWAGAGWGHIAIPRIGQEIIVDFLDGDPDQPIITGRTYDANHPTPYKLPALKTQQTVKSKEHKGGGYNELLIDDTTGEIKTQLHSTHGATQLTLGFLTHPRAGDGSGEHRGNGFELRTDEWGAIRAAKGMYISTDARHQAHGKQLDMHEAVQQLENALELAKSLAQAGRATHAIENDTIDQNAQLQNVYRELEQPGMLLSAPSGIALTSRHSAQISTEQNITFTAAQHIDSSTAKDYRIAAGDNISLFTVEQDIKILANKGKIQLQAQHNQMDINAQDDLNITSSKGKTLITAKNEIILNSGGAYIKLKDGHIEIGGPGTLDIKIANMKTIGPASYTAPLPHFNKTMFAYQKNGHYQGSLHLLDAEQKPIADAIYKIVSASGQTLAEGVTDLEGKSMQAITDEGPNATLFIGQGEWTITEEIIEIDDLGCGCDAC